MAGRSARSRRTAIEWSVRLLIASTIAALAYVSMTYTVGYVLRDRDTARAHAFSPRDGRITALLAQQIIGAGPNVSATERSYADTLARAALRQDPTAVMAVSTLGVDSVIRGDTKAGEALLGYAKTLSRRDPQTQFWSIEDAVSRGQVADALRQYDISLRTTRSATDILYPVLADAIADPAIRHALTRTLTAQPVWGGPFVDYVSANGANPRATVALFLEMSRAGVPVPWGASATIISGLVAKGFVQDAWNYYGVIHRIADRRWSRDPNFISSPTTPSLFDWVPINAAAVNAAFLRSDHGGVLDYSASAGAGGPAVEQLQVLPTGSYRLKGRGDAIDLPDDQRPYWSLRCRDGRELGRVILPRGILPNVGFSGILTVPADCPVQNLILMIRPSDAVSGVAGKINHVQLGPA